MTRVTAVGSFPSLEKWGARDGRAATGVGRGWRVDLSWTGWMDHLCSDCDEELGLLGTLEETNAISDMYCLPRDPDARARARVLLSAWFPFLPAPVVANLAAYLVGWWIP